ncbi:MAG TPA: protein kinase [Gemmatimonadaceae bacterium]|nr:protein kinase [Gemmatimonadaceae bacterium]
MDDLSDLQAAVSGRYALEAPLGIGATATVYRARDLKHDRLVALKVLRPEVSHAVGYERFLREIRVTARLDHPNILPLLDSGDADGYVYYAMPYVEGETLRQRLTRDGQMPLADALRITLEIADALEYAHARGIVHRDIKPENILLTGAHARVADFGIARALEIAGGEALTETGLVVGTPLYMSPEQAAGEHTVDGRSDIYAIGCVAYEMLAGHPPFAGGSSREILARHALDPVPRLAPARPGIAIEVERAILTAMAKAPGDRFPTAASFAAALAKAPDAASRARAPRRRRALMMSMAAAVMLVGLLFGLRGMSGRSAPRSPAHDRTSIAVLPFENLSPAAHHAYFAGGLHDELLTQLSRVASLKVISRTSVLAYADERRNVPAIASELGVGSIVEGTVQVVEGRLRVNVQLVDAATDAQVWSQRYDRTLDDAFAIQSEIARQVVRAVGATLRGVERDALTAAPTADAEAYRLYLQGRERYLRPGRNRQDMEAAEALLLRAIARDTAFALARAQLSIVHGTMYWWRYDPSAERAAAQRREAEAALRLDRRSAWAHAAMGLAHYWGARDYEAALAELSVARDGLPNDARIWGWIGAVERRLGNWNGVAAAYRRATQLDPLDPNLFLDLGGTSHEEMRRYPEAVAMLNRALALDPDLHLAAVFKGGVYMRWHGQLDTLAAVLRRLPPDAGLGAHGTVLSSRLHTFLMRREPDSVLHLVTPSPVGVLESQVFYHPAALYAAWAHDMRGDRVLARAAFDTARMMLDSALRVLPSDWRLHAARGMALAGLGRAEDARREAEWLRRSVVYRRDAYEGPRVAEARANILAQLRDETEALAEIERLLTIPSWVSVQTLRLDPFWDPIRALPRFRALGQSATTP